MSIEPISRGKQVQQKNFIQKFRFQSKVKAAFLVPSQEEKGKSKFKRNLSKVFTQA